MTTLVETAKHTYACDRLSPFKALHVGRRLLPMLKGMEGIFAAAISNEAMDFAAALQEAGPILDTLAGLPDDQVEYIINTCLSAARRKGDNGQWFPCTTSQGDLMFADIDAREMLEISAGVIRENLESFFPDRDSISGDGVADKAPGQGIPTLVRNMRVRS